MAEKRYRYTYGYFLLIKKYTTFVQQMHQLTTL